MVMAVVLVSGCVTAPADGTSNNSLPVPGIIYVQGDMDILEGQCMERQLQDKVIMIYSPTCPVCEATKPILLEAAGEKGVSVEEINLLNDRQRLDELGVLPYYVPTTIIGCKVFVGMEDKETFISAMEAMDG